MGRERGRPKGGNNIRCFQHQPKRKVEMKKTNLLCYLIFWGILYGDYEKATLKRIYG